MSVRMMQALMAAGAGATDPHYSSVTSLLHFNGPNGSTTYTDEKGRAWSSQGTAPTISTALSKFGGSSLDIGVAAGNIRGVHDVGLEFPGDFTIEFWHYLRSRATDYPCLIGNYSTYGANGGLALFAGHLGDGTTRYQAALNGSFPELVTTGVSIAYSQWVHIAIVRFGTTLTLYINGNAEASKSGFSTTIVGTADYFWIGSDGTNPSITRIDGLVEDVRVTKGVARYTGNFTPPTAQFPDA